MPARASAHETLERVSASMMLQILFENDKKRTEKAMHRRCSPVLGMAKKEESDSAAAVVYIMEITRES